MSHALTNAKVFMGAYNLTGYTNKVALKYGAEPLDETVLGLDTRKSKGGLKIVSAGVGGYWDATPDPGLQAAVGVADEPFSIVAPPGTAGTVTYLFKAMNASYELSGTAGELLGYGAEARTTGDLIRGQLVYHGTVTATGSSTPISFPTMAATGTLWGALHVFSAPTSGTLDVIVQSDSATGFGSPVTQLTFTQVGTSKTSEWQSATGAIADGYMRVNYTPSGSCTFAVTLGIL